MNSVLIPNFCEQGRTYKKQGQVLAPFPTLTQQQVKWGHANQGAEALCDAY